MKLSDYFVTDAISLDLKATDRNGVIKELVGALVEAGSISAEDQDAVCRAIIQREKQGTTGFGKGVAVPHAKHAGVKKMISTVGRSVNGVDFAALDRAPVFIVMLLLSPADQPDEHLASMECIFRYLQRDNFRRFIRQAESREEIRELIREADDSSD
jgi:mannitol/fructose-specific phosphotransferase system IIA component (Ntr-type)